MAAAARSKGTPVWVRGTAGGDWRHGAVAAVTGGTVKVVLDPELGEGSGSTVTLQATAVEPANPTLLDGIR